MVFKIRHLIFPLGLALVCCSGDAFAAEQQGNPAIEFAQSEIDLGEIPEDVSEIGGQIVFFNGGNGPLKITKVSGPCKCFAGYSGDMTAAAVIASATR